MPVSTYGLTHLALAVKDPARAFGFYRDVFGMVAVYTQADFLQAQTPGSRDVLVFEKSTRRTGETGAIAHFGFRLTAPSDIDRAAAAVEKAEARDLDGYMVEIWYELPTKIDPPSGAATRTRRTRRVSKS
jgi:catechol 2,3-dioxygenase-like lactoylglutathione lyase family enzyme